MELSSGTEILPASSDHELISEAIYVWFSRVAYRTIELNIFSKISRSDFTTQFYSIIYGTRNFMFH